MVVTGCIGRAAGEFICQIVSVIVGSPLGMGQTFFRVAASPLDIVLIGVIGEMYVM